MFKLDQRVEKPEKAMNDEVSGNWLWDELALQKGITMEWSLQIKRSISHHPVVDYQITGKTEINYGGSLAEE